MRTAHNTAHGPCTCSLLLVSLNFLADFQAWKRWPMGLSYNDKGLLTNVMVVVAAHNPARGGPGKGC